MLERCNTNKKLHYILLGSILIIEATLIIIFFLNIFSYTTSRLNCYVDNKSCYTVLETSYYSAYSVFVYNLDNFLYLIIITLIMFSISLTTMISSIIFKNKYYNFVSYGLSFIVICLMVTMLIIARVGPQKIA